MESEGTSSDDLDVRLYWPGAAPGVAAERVSRAQTNGLSAQAPAPAPAASASVAARPEPRKEQGNTASDQVGLEVIGATLALISARLDALGGAEGSRAPYNSILGVLERIEHSVTALTRMLTDDQERTARSLHEVLQRTEETAEQLEALRRRVALRARGEKLSPEAIDSIAEAVAGRLSEPQPRRRSRRT